MRMRCSLYTRRSSTGGRWAGKSPAILMASAAWGFRGMATPASRIGFDGGHRLFGKLRDYLPQLARDLCRLRHREPRGNPADADGVLNPRRGNCHGHATALSIVFLIIDRESMMLHKLQVLHEVSRTRNGVSRPSGQSRPLEQGPHLRLRELGHNGLSQRGRVNRIAVTDARRQADGL